MQRELNFHKIDLFALKSQIYQKSIDIWTTKSIKNQKKSYGNRIAFLSSILEGFWDPIFLEPKITLFCKYWAPGAFWVFRCARLPAQLRSSPFVVRSEPFRRSFFGFGVPPGVHLGIILGPPDLKNSMVFIVYSPHCHFWERLRQNTARNGKTAVALGRFFRRFWPFGPPESSERHPGGPNNCPFGPATRENEGSKQRVEQKGVTRGRR